MTSALTIRRTRTGEFSIVAALWQEASAWLANRDLDQWQYPPRQGPIAASIAAGECWLVENGDKVVATITLDRHADPEFWRPEDRPTTALYIHRMVVTRAAAGAGLGSALLDWAARRADAEGKPWLRLDAWRTNERLQRYYAEQGFQLVRVVDLPHRGSGALYQRRSTVQLGQGPTVRELRTGEPP